MNLIRYDCVANACCYCSYSLVGAGLGSIRQSQYVVGGGGRGGGVLIVDVGGLAPVGVAVGGTTDNSHFSPNLFEHVDQVESVNVVIQIVVVVLV